MIAVDEAFLWHVQPERLGRARLRACWAILADDELERAEALHRPRGRLTYLVARALVRFALSAHAGVPPRAWRFRRAPHGKPELAGPEGGVGLCFSLSHTDGLIACLVARVEVGVDAERLRRRVPVMPLARRFFTAAEMRNLQEVPGAHRRERFLRLWTLKEAYLKARGLGLAGGLDVLSTHVSGGQPVETRMADDDPGLWRLGLPEVSEEHVVAYAVQSPAVRLQTCAAERIMR